MDFRIQKPILRYYYNPETGEFIGSSDRTDMIQMDHPYIDREQFFYSDYKIDPETLELIYTPVPRNPRELS